MSVPVIQLVGCLLTYDMKMPPVKLWFTRSCVLMPQELICRIRILLDAGAEGEGSAAQQQLDRHVRSFMTVSRERGVL